MLADEPAILPQAKFDEARVTDDDTLQAQKLIQIDRTTSGLADGAAPALDAILRRALSLDRVTGLGVFQRQESCCAGEQVARHFSDRSLRPMWQVHRTEFLQCFGAKDQRTELGRAGQVIADAVARRFLTVNRPLLLGINHRHIGADIEIGQVEARAGQPLVEEPEAARVTPGTFRSHQLLDGGGADGAK